MKIALVGPGSIGPDGIIRTPKRPAATEEILIRDYCHELIRLGHTVDIVDMPSWNSLQKKNLYSAYCKRLIERVNAGNYDFVHIHWEDLHPILPYLRCNKVGIMSHYPYLTDSQKDQGFWHKNIMGAFTNNKEHILFVLSEKYREFYIKHGADPENIIVALNGANHHEITPVADKKYPNKSVYPAALNNRKRQTWFANIPNIDFYGSDQDSIAPRLASYKGACLHGKLMKIIPNYGNMVLLSDGEGAPLVVKEALMAGLPIVVSSCCTNDLDVSLPFIDVIEEDKICDLKYVQNVIEENRKKQHYQQAIRKYAEDNFSWMHLVKKYITNIEATPFRKRNVVSINSWNYKIHYCTNAFLFYILKVVVRVIRKLKRR